MLRTLARRGRGGEGDVENGCRADAVGRRESWPRVDGRSEVSVCFARLIAGEPAFKDEVEAVERECGRDRRRARSGVLGAVRIYASLMPLSELHGTVIDVRDNLTVESPAFRGGLVPAGCRC